MLISFSHQNFFFWPDQMLSQSFFLWVINLTILKSPFGEVTTKYVSTIKYLLSPSKQHFPFPNTEISLISEDELFVELSSSSSVKDAFCLPGTALVPNQFMCDRVISGTEKRQKIAFLFAKLCCFHQNQQSYSLQLIEFHLTVNFSFLS